MAVPGLRAIALFEAAKGFLVIAAGLGLISLVHKDVQDMALRLLLHLHLNPARRYPHIFLQAAMRLQDSNLLLLAAGAFAYSTLRFAEAYGLWRDREWAQWIAIVSGLAYIPFELAGLAKGITPMKLSLLAANVCVVLFVGFVRARSIQ